MPLWHVTKIKTAHQTSRKPDNSPWMHNLYHHTGNCIFAFAELMEISPFEAIGQIKTILHILTDKSLIIGTIKLGICVYEYLSL